MSTSVSGNHSKLLLFMRAKRRVLLAALAVIFVLVIVQTPWGLGHLARLGLHWSGVDVRFKSLGGFWMTSLEVRGLEARFDAVDLRADTVRVRHNIWSLVAGRLHMRELLVAGPEIQLASTSESQDDSVRATPLNIRVDRVTLRRGRLVLPDSTMVMSSVFLAGRWESNREISVDTLAGILHWKGGVQDMSVAGRGQLADGVLAVDTLRVAGRETVFTVAGQLGGDSETDLTIRAAPLKLGELQPFIPASEEMLTLDVRLRGPSSQIRMEMEGAFSDNGRLFVSATMDTSLSHWRIDSMSVADVNPSLFADIPSGIVSAHLNAALEGRSLEEMTGTVNLVVVESLVDDLFVDAANVAVQLEDAQAEIALDALLGSASLEAQGKVGLLPLQGVLTGEFRNFDLGRYVNSYSSDLNGAFSLDLSSLITSEVTLGPGTIRPS